jgi:hypothetical protein
VASKLNQVTVGIYGAMAWAIVLLVLWSTTPASIRPIGVTLWFLVLLVALSAGLAIVLDVAKRLFGPKKPEGRSFGPSKRQGLLLGIWITVLLALSSLRQLSLRDVLLTGVLVIIMELYLRLT